MKLASFVHAGRASYGVVRDTVLRDLGAVPDAPANLMALLALGDAGRAWLDAEIDTAPTIPLADVHLQAPIPAPRKFLGLGGNYESHLAEARKINLERPKACQDRSQARDHARNMRRGDPPRWGAFCTRCGQT